MTHAELEEFIVQFPVYQYAFVKPRDVEFDDSVRVICKKECPHYGSSWSCPPAIGKILQCKERCNEYSDVLFLSTVTEVSDITNVAEVKITKNHHEKLTRIIEDFMQENGLLTYTLTSDTCNLCQKCGFPKEKCRHPKQMHPCIESNGIMAVNLAELCGMDYYMGENLKLWFTMIFYRQ